ncbi:carboxymuconolactone decarboxylase family protein [Alterinioella nitratireducens]|uniref:carboxymuconolactone decarboxylase family protein n=1 Tax=Alterinioella nitratireducens TaxID=2735915 RepID=UPI00405A2614
MPLLPSLPDTARLSDLLGRFPAHAGPLLTHVDGVMRAGAPLTAAECELIAAYVSGLNACAFCLGSHRIYAEALGIAPGLVDALLADPETAPVDPAMRPLLAYVAKLNTLPPRLTPGDVQAVLEAGWSEAALYHAIQVAALFNLFNRLVEGAGVNFSYGPDDPLPTAADLDHSYAGFAARMGLTKPA